MFRINLIKFDCQGHGVSAVLSAMLSRDIHTNLSIETVVPLANVYGIVETDLWTDGSLC